jgi:UDP-glucuronate decarboxylase
MLGAASKVGVKSHLVDGLIRLMESSDDVSGPINLGNPNEFAIRELAEVIIDLTGSASKIVHRPLPTDDPRQRKPDISKASELLNWQPKLPLREGLAKTIAYFQDLLAAEHHTGQ